MNKHEYDPRSRKINDIAKELQDLRVELTAKVARMAELASELRTLSRRSSDTYGHITFANSYIRLAGAINQGLTRTKSTDRLLAKDQAVQEEAYRQDELKQKSRNYQRKLEAMVAPTQEAFDELYGDIVGGNNA